MKILQAKRPSYRPLQALAMPFSAAVAMSAKKKALSRLVLHCRYICENASPEIRLVSSRVPICN
jgi:hypothetical protein